MPLILLTVSKENRSEIIKKTCHERPLSYYVEKEQQKKVNGLSKSGQTSETEAKKDTSLMTHTRKRTAQWANISN